MFDFALGIVVGVAIVLFKDKVIAFIKAIIAKVKGAVAKKK